jgi:hypothetical protein
VQPAIITFFGFADKSSGRPWDAVVNLETASLLGMSEDGRGLSPRRRRGGLGAGADYGR